MAVSNIQSIASRRRSPVREVQDEIRQMERSIDGALAENGELIAKMIRVGQVAKLSPAAGQKALERAIECLTAGTRMRALALATHEDLRGVVGKIDLRELGWGDMDDSPSDIAQDAGAATPAVAR